MNTTGLWSRGHDHTSSVPKSEAGGISSATDPEKPCFCLFVCLFERYSKEIIILLQRINEGKRSPKLCDDGGADSPDGHSCWTGSHVSRDTTTRAATAPAKFYAGVKGQTPRARVLTGFLQLFRVDLTRTPECAVVRAGKLNC